MYLLYGQLKSDTWNLYLIEEILEIQSYLNLKKNLEVSFPMRYGNKRRSVVFIILLASAILLAVVSASGLSSTQPHQTSDHFDGKLYFNPASLQLQTGEPQHQNRGFFSFAWRWLIGTDRPAWPTLENLSPGPRPDLIVSGGTIRITPVGHATFLIQMDGLNLLTDPIWSDRCSPVSWAGPSGISRPVSSSKICLPLMPF